MYPSKTRVRELQERFGVTNGQIHGKPRYTNLNWYLGDTRYPTTFEHLEWFCFGDVHDDDLERLAGLLKIDEKLLLGWKDLQPNDGDDTPPLPDGNRMWIYIVTFGVIFDKRVGWENGKVFTLDTDGIPQWKQVITSDPRVFGEGPKIKEGE